MLIHGIVVCRNEWGVLALSITNVLVNHADVVHVLDHGSSDQTVHGLKILKEIWGERLKIYSTRADLPFHQSLLTNMVASIAEKEGADWIYVFDSDEFLLPKQNFSLREELSKLSNAEVGIRYFLSNYISTYDFNENILNNYKKLIYKSKPSNNYNSLLARNLINSGELSFFDVPFPPKIIYRANKNLLIGKGAHSLRFISNKQSIVNLTLTDCAHLSLISKGKLAKKSMHGKSLSNLGLPPEIGWQNQLIYQLDIEGRLDWFWEKHSVRAENHKNINPTYKIDGALAECLKTSIEILNKKFGGENISMLFGAPLNFGYAEETNFGFNDVFEMCQFFDKKIELLLRVNKN